MVATQLRIVFIKIAAAAAEVWVVASKYEDEGESPDERADLPAELPVRTVGATRRGPDEARAEVRDRETYYAELRFAVHCQSRSVPAPRAALDDQVADTRERRRNDESWDDMTARFGDTWT
jgi:hypothetical protein